MEWLLIILLAAVLVYLAWEYIKLRGWVRQEERRIREDAIKKSEAVIRGKVTEHLIPYFPEFKYNPKDVRFIGTPVDLIVFDGLSEGEVKQVLFIEVKTGKESSVTPRERLVRNCIQNKTVSYEIMRAQTTATPGG